MNIEVKTYSEWKTQVTSKGLFHFSEFKNGNYKLFALDGNITFFHYLEVGDNEDYESTYLPNANKKLGSYYQREPFASKVLPNGMKLFRRKHGYKETILAGQSKGTKIVTPYDQCKINKLEVIGANPLDRIDLKVLDTPAGLLTGVPNYMLNQFGFNVVVSELLYSDKSDYDADLIKDMQVEITYYNDSSNDITVGYNIIFHEVKL